ncbi:hypothetical protein, partial [Phascolarctobacterium faecium]|uniref:hypothetical protein n=1 Tax=Phascolarctobacterium faecium TaxID=33025 RepID=UPI003AB74D8F
HKNKIFLITKNYLLNQSSQILLPTRPVYLPAFSAASACLLNLTALSVLFNSIIIKFCTEGKNPAPNTEKLP